MSRDLRRYANQTNVRLFIGFVLILFIVGIGLINYFYGGKAALLGVLCLVIGLAPLFLIWLLLSMLGWVARRANRD